jgi:hypothetical protein
MEWMGGGVRVRWGLRRRVVEGKWWYCFCFAGGTGSDSCVECKQRQHQDGPSYSSFLGACMHSVHAYDKAVAATSSEKGECELESGGVYGSLTIYCAFFAFLRVVEERS